MKSIIINNTYYPIDCSAFTYIKYSSFFENGIIEDINYIKKYLAKQTLLAQKYEEEGKSETESIELIQHMLEKDLNDLVIKVTRLAWILIYTANESIDPYEKWIKSLKKFSLSDSWIAEVTEFAVSTFC